MKWIKTLENLKDHFFEKKEKLKKRTKGQNNVEKPKVIFKDFCNTLAEKLSKSGYKFSPSQNKYIYYNENKQYFIEIQLNSSIYNVAGEYVELKCTYSIESKDLLKFTKVNPLINYYRGILFSGDIGEIINKNEGDIIWNLNSENEYNDAIHQIENVCKNDLIFFLNNVEKPDYVINGIINNNLSLTNHIITIQYLLLFNKKDIAEKYLTNLIFSSKKSIKQDYLDCKSLYANKILPDYFVQGVGLGNDIALLEKVYELDLKIIN